MVNSSEHASLIITLLSLMEYQPREIENKWQTHWKKNKTYEVRIDHQRPKYYVLDMFPYPSGAGLHVGHPLGYIASDIFSRYKRLCGYNVLHPMGFDSFGLPAEQYAIQTGIHPAVSTQQNIQNYRRQLELLGLSFDWSRTIISSEPQYYRWTQWIFMQLFNHYYDFAAGRAQPIQKLVKVFSKKGNKNVQAACDEDTPTFTAAAWNAMSERQQWEILLKYRLTYPGEAWVNWCPGLGCVLSNDEVKDGVSERGGFPVERRRMKQWNMRITAYADRLIAGLDEIDWPEPLKEQQRNFIGRSVGAAVLFPVAAHEHVFIEVFTTRVDTIFGTTFMVLAPEHELVPLLTTNDRRSEVEAYVRWAGSRTDVERMAEVKKVTGAFTGSYAIHPLTGRHLPIYIADYVLAGYGTGAIMAVPSGDQRDWHFAQHFNLPVVQILDTQKDLDIAADPTRTGKYVNSDFINGMTYDEAVPTLIARLEKKKLGRSKVQYRLRDAIFSRQRYWGEPVPVYWKEGLPYLIDEKDLPLVLPMVDKYLPTETGEPPLGRAENWKYTAPDGKQYEYELSTMPGWAGSSWYWYRYMDAKNDKAFASKKAIQYWRDVDLYLGGSEHAVGHLLYSRFWNHFLYDLKRVPCREYARKLINQGMILGRSNFVYRAKEKFFEQYLKIKVLQPFFADLGIIEFNLPEHEEAIQYDFAFASTNLVIEVTSKNQPDKIERVRRAAEADGKRLLVLFNEVLAAYINEPEKTAAVIRHALNSRDVYQDNDSSVCNDQLFVSYNLTHKYSADCFSRLYVDIHLVENDTLNLTAARQHYLFADANFKVDVEGKFTCSREVEKMSKSKLNVVVPDNIIEQYGVDCFRMFEMFLGPITDSKPWNTQGISGVFSFLKKFWSCFFDDNGNWSVSADVPTRDELRVLHHAIKKVTEDIDRFQMNTCISHFMIAVNELRKLNCSKRAILEPLTILMTPFAPHICEEIWQRLGNQGSVCDATWPPFNEEYLKKDTVIYPVQINGKHRGNVEVSAGLPVADIEKITLEQEFVRRYLSGGVVRKIIVVPGRIVNIVV